MTATILSEKDKAIVAAIIEAARRKPNFVYTPFPEEEGGGCSYFPDPKNPDGCIVGHAIRQVFGSEANEQIIDGPAAYALLSRHFGIADRVADWATIVQWYQDDGNPWIYAVNKAGPAPV